MFPGGLRRSVRSARADAQVQKIWVTRRSHHGRICEDNKLFELNLTARPPAFNGERNVERIPVFLGGFHNFRLRRLQTPPAASFWFRACGEETRRNLACQS